MAVWINHCWNYVITGGNYSIDLCEYDYYHMPSSHGLLEATISVDKNTQRVTLVTSWGLV